VIPIIFQAIQNHHGEQSASEGNYLLALIYWSNNNNIKNVTYYYR